LKFSFQDSGFRSRSEVEDSGFRFQVSLTENAAGIVLYSRKKPYSLYLKTDVQVYWGMIQPSPNYSASKRCPFLGNTLPTLTEYAGGERRLVARAIEHLLSSSGFSIQG